MYQLLFRRWVSYETVFGLPHPDIGDPYLIYAGQQYLLIANELFVVRVAVTDPVDDEAAQTASIDVPVAGGQIKVYSSCAEPWYFQYRSILSLPS